MSFRKVDFGDDNISCGECLKEDEYMLFMIMILTWVPESTIKGFGWGLGEARLVAADSRDSSFSILSMRSMVPLARISSTMAMDSASDTGPEPVVVTLGEFATGDPVTPGPGRGERLDSGDTGAPGGSDRLEVKLSRLGKSQPGSQSKSSSSSESPPLSLVLFMEFKKINLQLDECNAAVCVMMKHLLASHTCFPVFPISWQLYRIPLIFPCPPL